MGTNAFWTLSLCSTDQAFVAEGIDPIRSETCQHGDVFLGYASPEFIVLGFSVLMFLISIEVCNGRLFQHYSLFARTGHLTISVVCCYDRFPAALL